MYVLLGLPPQIKWIRYAPGQHFTQFITKEHAIACDMFGTTGMYVCMYGCMAAVLWSKCDESVCMQGSDTSSCGRLGGRRKTAPPR